MDEKKVLVIAYYWPPSGGSGVQRWLKFVKYLPSFGVTPIVFTPENPAFDIKDASLEKDVPAEAEVIRFPIWEPYEAFFAVSRFFGGKKSTKPTDLVGAGTQKGLFQKVSTWLRGNLMIPDPRVFWVKPSVRILQDIIRDNQIHTIITTGPPHSIHLIGYRLKKKMPSVKWLADFRDPWSEWGFLDTLMVGSITRKFHRVLEKKVLMRADIVTTITPFYVRSFEKLAGRKVELLTNGYDEDDFARLSPLRTSRFVIRHVGIMNEECNPRPFMQALKQAMREDPEIGKVVTLDFVGEVHPAFRADVGNDDELKSVTTFTPSVPHKQLIDLYNNSSLLLIVLEGYKDAEGYMPGKLFEYIATGLPILGVGPENGDAGNLMKSANAGEMIAGNDVQRINKVIQKHFAEWKNPTRSNSTISHENYSRRAITGKLVDLLGLAKK